MNIKQILVWIKQRRHNRLQKIQTSSNFKNWSRFGNREWNNEK
jgi:hypothetical protein